MSQRPPCVVAIAWQGFSSLRTTLSTLPQVIFHGNNNSQKRKKKTAASGSGNTKNDPQPEQTPSESFSLTPTGDPYAGHIKTRLRPTSPSENDSENTLPPAPDSRQALSDLGTNIDQIPVRGSNQSLRISDNSLHDLNIQEGRAPPQPARPPRCWIGRILLIFCVFS